MTLGLCDIEVLEPHVAGAVGIHNRDGYAGQVPVTKGQRLVGVYQFETACGSFTCYLVDGHPIYFEAKKVKVTRKVNEQLITASRGNMRNRKPRG